MPAHLGDTDRGGLHSGRSRRSWRARPLALAARGVMVTAMAFSIASAVPAAQGTQAARPVVADLATMTAVITGASDGVNVRAKPSFDAAVVATVYDGTSVRLRIADTNTVLDPDGVTRWWPISVDGQDGWVIGYYLNDPEGVAGAGLRALGEDGGNASAAASADQAASSSGNAVASSSTATSASPAASTAPSAHASADPLAATARVAEADGVNIRREPKDDAAVVTAVSPGTVVVLRTDVADTVTDASGQNWWPVSVDGQDGWVIGAYLTSGADETAAAPSGANQQAVSFAPGSRAVASTSTNDGVNIRAEANPSGQVIGYIRPGDIVQIMGGPAGNESSTTGWYQVTNGDVTGYVDGDLLQPASQPSDASAATTTGTANNLPNGPDISGATVNLVTRDGTGVNIRDSAGTSATVVAAAPENTLGTVLDGPFGAPDGSVWYYVSTDYGEGFVLAEYVSVASSPAQAATSTQPASSDAPTAAPTASSASTSAPVATPTPAAKSAGAGVATGTFIFPAAGRISQGYGCTTLSLEPYNASLGCNFHDALDIAAAMNTPIMAADGGTVVFAGWCDCGLGYEVKIDHGNGYATTYGHMASQPYVTVGEQVAQGDVIGPMGSTGNSTGPHTHFMIELNGQTIDPTSVLSSLSVN